MNAIDLGAIELAALLPLIDTLGWTLLHFFWQGAAIGVLFAAGRLLLDLLRASANARYLLGLGCIGLLALAPIITFGWLWTSQASGAAPAVIDSVATAMPASALSGSGNSSGSSWSLAMSLQQALPWLVLAWVTGVLMLSGRVLLNWRRARGMTRTGIDQLQQSVQQSVARLIEQFDIKRRVKVFESALVQVPTVIGWLKPVILLPTSAILRLTPTQLELVIAHELGHIRRFDYLVNLIQVAVETLLFYHPVVRWISRDVRMAREVCCDDLVVNRCGHVTEYAKALASLEAMRGEVVMPGLAATGGPLLHRIERMFHQSTDTREVVPVPGHGLALGALLIIALIGGQSISTELAAATTAFEPASAPLEPVLLDKQPWAEPLDSDEAGEPAPANSPESDTTELTMSRIDAPAAQDATTEAATAKQPAAVDQPPDDHETAVVIKTQLSNEPDSRPIRVAVAQPTVENKPLPAPKPVALPVASGSKQQVPVAEPASVAAAQAAVDQQRADPVATVDKAKDQPVSENAIAPVSNLIDAPVIDAPAIEPPEAEAARLEVAKIDPPALPAEPGLAVPSVLQPIYKEAPAYPQRAQRRGQEGHVVIEYSLRANGKVTGLKVIDAKPRRIFNQAAKAALREWRYPPAEPGEVRDQLFRQRFNFTLGASGTPLKKCVVTTGSRICRGNLEVN